MGARDGESDEDHIQHVDAFHDRLGARWKRRRAKATTTTVRSFLKTSCTNLKSR